MTTKRTQRTTNMGPQGGLYVNFHGVKIYLRDVPQMFDFEESIDRFHFTPEAQ